MERCDLGKNNYTMKRGFPHSQVTMLSTWITLHNSDRLLIQLFAYNNASEGKIIKLNNRTW